MENVEEHSAYLHFNEEELIPLLSSISNIEYWENGSVSNALLVFSHSTNFLSIPSLARIVDEQCYTMQPQKKTSLFTIPLIELLAYLHEAYKIKAIPVTDSEYYECYINAGKIIGFDKNQSPTSYITVVRDKLGNITNAFPGEASNNK